MFKLRLDRRVRRRALPFVAAFAAGVGLTFFFDFGTRPPVAGPDSKPADAGTAAPAAPADPVQASPTTGARIEPPSIHVLSTMLIDESLEMQRLGGYVDVLVTSPPDVLYVSATPKEYRQGVLQVSFLFGADGRISEVAPVARRVLCGPCLEGDRWVHGEKVVSIDERDPRLREYVEAAAAALRRIEFVPAYAAGRPYPTHGFAECVFRLD